MKRIFILMLAVTLLFCMSACGNSEEQTVTEGTPAAPETEATETEAVTPPPTEAEATETEAVTTPSTEAEENQETEALTTLDSGFLWTGVEWRIYDNGLLEITGDGPMAPVLNSEDIKWHAYRTMIKDVYIGDGITTVSQFAFRDCVNLQTVRFPESLEKIELEAFERCSALKEIRLPEGLTQIEYWAFAGCDALETLEIPGSITHLDNYTFQACLNLREVVIRPGVETIGFDVFDGCVNLQKIYIPYSVTKIDVYTFRECEKLADVYFSGTEQQWKEMILEAEGNDPLFLAKVHYDAEYGA